MPHQAPIRSALHPVAAVPEETAERYRQLGYWVDQTIPDFLTQSCRANPRAEALVARSCATLDADGAPAPVRWSYARLESQGLAAARRLVEAGVRPGDRVLLQLPNLAEYLSYLLGIFWAGALPVFCLPAHRQRELVHFAELTDAAAHVFSQRASDTDAAALYQSYSAELIERGLTPPRPVDADRPLPEAPPPTFTPVPPVQNTASTRASQQVAFLQLSGGTTGLSKLIPRTHADYLYSVRESAEICGLSRATRMLVVLPAAHNFTMSSPGILGALAAGSTLVFAADPSPQTAFRLIETERITFTALVPPLAQAWLASAARRSPDLSSLQVLQVGGAKLAPSVAARITPVLGARLQQVFGMAEGLVNYTRAGDAPELVASVQGRPISPADEIRVVDSNDRQVPCGTSGHLLTRGPYTIRGYYRNDRANRESFTDDGFYRTGDLVRLHPGGYIEVTGRAKDQINRNGEKIAVDEIEDLALTHPQIQDAVALGLPDESVGERLALVLVLRTGAELTDPHRRIQEFFRERGLAPYKIPERVEVLPAFPVTNIGKISRRTLREKLLAHLTSER